jgi:hypothetical protein
MIMWRGNAGLPAGDRGYPGSLFSRPGEPLRECWHSIAHTSSRIKGEYHAI